MIIDFLFIDSTSLLTPSNNQSFESSIKILLKMLGNIRCDNSYPLGIFQKQINCIQPLLDCRLGVLPVFFRYFLKLRG